VRCVRTNKSVRVLLNFSGHLSVVSFQLVRSALHKRLVKGVGRRRNMIGACLLLLFVLLIVTWTIVNNSQKELIEFKSRQIANVVASQAKTARSLYSKSVVAKLKRDGFSASTSSDDHIGSVPIPAQFLKLLSHDSSEKHKNEYRFQPISKWNLSPEQGLRDEFQRWAWAGLEQQANGVSGIPSSWKPVWRIEEVNGKQALRYMVADPAASMSCVNCHNTMEKTPTIQAIRQQARVEVGKTWQLHDLIGALEVIVPLDESSELAAGQTKDAILLILGVAITGLLLVMGIAAIDDARGAVLRKDLEYQARHDLLTTLPNRAGFEFQANALIDTESGHFDSHIVMLLDLNEFKIINDTLGHQTGDEVLKQVASRLRRCATGNIVVARLGGDEFALIIPDANAEGARELAKAIEHALDAVMEIGEYRLNTRASIGIARMPEDGDELNEILRCADVAMYHAKKNKASYSFYDSEYDHNSLNTLSIINDFKSVLENDGLSLVYQPKFDLTEGVISGVEALLRWDHPEFGMVSPLRVIPMAEQSGQIGALTRWTINTALVQLKLWQNEGHDIQMAVNLSAKMLDSVDTVTMILELLQVHGIACNRLITEVTETAIMRDALLAEQLLARLHRSGVVVSLDDFGTGYSSLAHVHKLKLNELKLDRSFLTNLSQAKNRAILKTTIELASNLELDLIAEGVEDAGTLALLLDMNCTKFQGYYLARPMAAELLTNEFDKLGTVALDWSQRHASRLGLTLHKRAA